MTRVGAANVITVERESTPVEARPPREAAPPVEASPPAPVTLADLELPRGRRPGWPTLAALAIATGVVALGLGGWAVVSGATPEAQTRLDGARLDRALAVLADSRAVRRPLRGSVGRIVLVVAPDDTAVLALDGLGPAPAGRRYEAWLVPPGSATPVPAASFDGRDRVVLLAQPVAVGARVGVTLESAAGADRPTRPLRLIAERGV